VENGNLPRVKRFLLKLSTGYPQAQLRKMNQLLTVAILCCGASLIFSIFALWRATRATKTATERIQIPSKKLTEIESRIAVVESLAEDTATTLTQLTNKVKMMRVRSAAAHTDPQSEPTSVSETKDWLRRKAGLTAGQPARHA
jgi:hypothetical protein